jgi:hypothetical protein
MRRHPDLFALALTTLLALSACEDDTATPSDVTSPARVTDLTVSLAGEDSLRLQWSAPGDDGGSGSASSYQIRRSGSPISGANFGSAAPVANPPAPLTGGTTQVFIVAGIDTTIEVHFALRAIDDAGNASQVSNDAPWFPAGTPQHLVKNIPPVKDNSMYEEGDYSNGAGQYIFTGENANGDVPPPDARRALLAFAIADSLPAGAVIDSVRLTMRMSKAPAGDVAHTISLHRLNADWGEGASNATGEEGTGDFAAINDATWLHRFYNTVLWTTAGGDFVASASAGTSVPVTLGFYAWQSAQMAADVQSWLDTPANNFGWIVIGEESMARTARRFDSREHPTVANRPVLRVYYTVTP